jgi:hypothetical protein
MISNEYNTKLTTLVKYPSLPNMKLSLDFVIG